jgi:hypothetical protein
MTTQDYARILATSLRVNWRVEDVIGGERRLDFERPFLPETFARTQALTFLSDAERLTLNHVRAHGYLAMFELVEQFIVPFIGGQVEGGPAEGGSAGGERVEGEQTGKSAPEQDARHAALGNFVVEERKHLELFRRFRSEFRAAFGSDCGFIGPADEIARAVLAHRPLAVAIAVLGIEWMSQGHYLESIRDAADLDTQFKSLLRHHWIEEVQHARLDGLLLQELARDADAEEIEAALAEYFEIGAFIDGGLRQQAGLDATSFERAVDRRLTDAERSEFVDVQHRALRWTFLGSAMSNPNFLDALGVIGNGASARIRAAAIALS